MWRRWADNNFSRRISVVEFENHLLSQSASTDTNTLGNEGPVDLERKKGKRRRDEKEKERRVRVLCNRGIPHRAGECRSLSRYL
jgi:hypothetical protein